MRRSMLGPVVACAAAAFASAASARPITFSGLSGANGDPMPNPYTEGGFSVTPSLGSWSQAFMQGNPVPSIFTGDDFAQVLVHASSMGQFRFASADLIGNSAGQASVSFLGRLNGAMVFDAGMGITSFSWDTEASPDPTAVIDELQIGIVLHGVTSINLDNIVVTAVPAPGAAALFALGLPLLSARRRR
jgi:hypothetical protein